MPGIRTRCAVFGTMLMVTASPVIAAPAERTFAEAFFVARRADGGLEILGSVVIWLLLAMSIFGIGLIVSMAVANRRQTILPDDLVDRIGKPLESGQYEQAIAAADEDGSYFGRVMSGGLKAWIRVLDPCVRGVRVPDPCVQGVKIEI